MVSGNILGDGSMDRRIKTIVAYGIGSFVLIDVPVFIELLTGWKTAPINFPDIIDITLFVPFMAIILLSLYRSYNIRDKKLSTILLIAYVIFFEGHGVHWAANALDLLQHCEGADCLARFGEAAESQKLAYFLDEIIGHKLMYYPLFLILLIFLLIDTELKMSRQERFLLYLSGVLHGFYLIVATVEGQTGIEGLIFAALALIICLRMGLSDTKKRPFALFMLTTSIVMLVLGISWWAYWGALVQPSKILKF